MSSIPHAILMVEGRQTVWLSAPHYVRQEVAGESYNADTILAIVRGTGGQLGTPLVAWLVPEPVNPHDRNAVMVWIKGGRVGYLPAADAFFWQRAIFELQHHYHAPVACAAHAELPPEGSSETSLQIVLWLPPLPWLNAAVHRQTIAVAMAEAAAEPAARAARAEQELRAVAARQKAYADKQAELALLAKEQRQAELAQRRVEAEEAIQREVEKVEQIRRERVAMEARFGAENTVRIHRHEIWQGQTEEMLLASRGAPLDIDTKVLKTKSKSTFKYGHDGGKRYRLRVFLEGGVVVGWEDKT